MINQSGIYDLNKEMTLICKMLLNLSRGKP